MRAFQNPLDEWWWLSDSVCQGGVCYGDVSTNLPLSEGGSCPRKPQQPWQPLALASAPGKLSGGMGGGVLTFCGSEWMKYCHALAADRAAAVHAAGWGGRAPQYKFLKWKMWMKQPTVYHSTVCLNRMLVWKLPPHMHIYRTYLCLSLSIHIAGQSGLCLPFLTTDVWPSAQEGSKHCIIHDRKMSRKARADHFFCAVSSSHLLIDSPFIRTGVVWAHLWQTDTVILLLMSLQWSKQ